MVSRDALGGVAGGNIGNAGRYKRGGKEMRDVQA